MITSAIESLRSEMNKRLPAMLEDIEALVSIESPTGDKATVDRAQDFLSEKLHWAGAEVERIPQSQVGDHLRAVWHGQGDKNRDPLLAIGHVDTVWAVGELSKRPVRVEEGFIFGPGVFDMKAGLMITIHAMKTLLDLGLRLKRDLVFIINSDEEVGSLTSRAMIEEQASRSHSVMVLEPAFDTDRVTLARKGVGRFFVHVKGKAAHAGRDPQNGVSAIEEMAHQILYLQSLSAPEQGTTLNVGVVHGGTLPNVVPAEAHADVDLRVMRTEDADRLVEQIMGLTSHNPRAIVEVKGGITRPPWEPNTVCEALFHRARAVGLLMGINLDKGYSGGGSDGNFTAALGIPTIDGMGPEGFGAHAIDERVRIDSIPKRATLLAGLILDLASNGVKD